MEAQQQRRPQRQPTLYMVERDILGYEGPYEYLLPYEALTGWEKQKLGLVSPRTARQRKK